LWSGRSTGCFELKKYTTNHDVFAFFGLEHCDFSILWTWNFNSRLIGHDFSNSLVDFDDIANLD
jgi:hypothetical protein